MSLVALGPEIQVSGRVMSIRCIASGSRRTMLETGTTHTWWSGTREIARRPWSPLPSSTMVPDSAMETAEEVSTASVPSSSATLSTAPGPSMRRRASPAGTASANQVPSMPCGTTKLEASLRRSAIVAERSADSTTSTWAL